MFITTKLVLSIETGEVLEREGYEYSGPLELACGPSAGEKDAAATLAAFSKVMIGQAKTVFGAANTVFNDLMKGFHAITAGGPSQHGMSAAEISALKSQAITDVSKQYRSASAAVKSAQAAIGGGNVVMPSGSTVTQDVNLASSAAQATASELADINVKDYEIGRENYWKAAEGEMKLPEVYSTAGGYGKTALEGAKESFDVQQQMGAESGWWKGALTGAIGAGVNAFTGGLGSGLAKDITGQKPPQG